jgi:hypothetical protein
LEDQRRDTVTMARPNTSWVPSKAHPKTASIVFSQTLVRRVQRFAREWRKAGRDADSPDVCCRPPFDGFSTGVAAGPHDGEGSHGS